MTSKRLSMAVIVLVALASLGGLDWFAPNPGSTPNSGFILGSAHGGLLDSWKAPRTSPCGDPDEYANDGLEGDPDEYAGSDTTGTGDEDPSENDPDNDDHGEHASQLLQLMSDLTSLLLSSGGGF